MSNKVKRGYVYIGSLPHGFYEDQIRSYFKQFGRVLRIRLSRSKKTGNYRGYGFIEFENENVAKIAADTMNNYLMFNKLIKCKVIPKNQLHKLTFKNCNHEFVPAVKSHFRRAYNSTKSKKELEANKEKTKSKLLKKQKKLNELGIDLNLNKVLGRNDVLKEAKIKQEDKVEVKQETEIHGKEKTKKRKVDTINTNESKKAKVEKTATKVKKEKSKQASDKKENNNKKLKKSFNS